jgi:hypothetical protein
MPAKFEIPILLISIISLIVIVCIYNKIKGNGVKSFKSTSNNDFPKSCYDFNRKEFGVSDNQARFTCGYKYDFDYYNNCVAMKGTTGLDDECMNKCKF